MADTTNWDSLIGAKYLRVMRNVIKLPYQSNSESQDMIAHYEMLSFVVSKSLSPIIEKIKRDMKMTAGD